MHQVHKFDGKFNFIRKLKVMLNMLEDANLCMHLFMPNHVRMGK